MKVFAILFLFVTVFSSAVCSQTKPIATEIAAKNVFNLSIIDLFPDSFPKVSVVFQAKNKLNEPLWLLQKDEIRVTENNEDCEVLDVFNITENKSLNIGLVFDYSGSMIDNPSERPAHLSAMGIQELYFSKRKMPENYTPSIDYAKKGVLAFISDRETLEDSILFIGFNHKVDKIVGLTNKPAAIRKLVTNIAPRGSTAFYDALYMAVDSLSNHHSQPAIIGLTDGQDNVSKHSYSEVIVHAQNKNIPIYIIGLGSVDSILLGIMAEQTKGLYYHTNNADALVDVYQNIKKQLKSIYQVDYRSNNLNAADTTRDLAFEFVNDTLSFANNTTQLELPVEAIEYLEKQAEIRAANTAFRQRMIGGGIGLIVLLGIGAFAIRRAKKKKATPIIKKHYPNPVVDILTLELAQPIVGAAVLSVLNSSGVSVKEVSINGSVLECRVDVTGLETGWYLLQIQTSQGPSNSIKVLKQ